MKQALLFLLLVFTNLSCQLTFKSKKPLLGQNTPITKAPEIKKKKWGLFISGAGAHSFASLPILEMIHKHNLSFDLIAGTGWGAWIAAVYAQNQSIDELKWQTFKLKEKSVFGTKWFDNKQKRISALQKLTKQVLLSKNLITDFFCPALDKKTQQILWINLSPIENIFNCLNKIPPLFFSFPNATGTGSLFSAIESLYYMKNKKKIDHIIWIKPSISFKKGSYDMVFSIFWKELIAKLHHNIQQDKRFSLLILEISPANTSVYDFEKIHKIIETPVPLTEQEKINKFKNKTKEK